jgi:hypothetical protein
MKLLALSCAALLALGAATASASPNKTYGPIGGAATQPTLGPVGGAVENASVTCVLASIIRPPLFGGGRIGACQPTRKAAAIVGGVLRRCAVGAAGGALFDLAWNWTTNRTWRLGQLKKVKGYKVGWTGCAWTAFQPFIDRAAG